MVSVAGSSVEQVGSWGRASTEFAMYDLGNDGVYRARSRFLGRGGARAETSMAEAGMADVVESRARRARTFKANLRCHQLMANDRVADQVQVVDLHAQRS